MPSESKREKILQNVFDALKGIAAGATYFTTPRTVSREWISVDERPASEFPMLIVSGGAENARVADRTTRSAHLTVEVRGFVRRAGGPASGGEALSQSLNRLLRDVEVALAQDETRGGVAGQTDPVSVEVDETSLADLAGFLFQFDVFYVAKRTEP